MARHTWHRTPNRNNDADYRSLTAGARCLLRDIDEMLYREEVLTANVSTLAGWFGLDRKTTREGIEAIAATSLLRITKEERGKAGTFYTISNPKRTSNESQTNPEPTPNEPQANPERAPHKSANDAGSGDASLNRIEDRSSNKTKNPPKSPTGGADADASAGGVFLVIETKDGKSYHLTNSQVDEWQDALPRVDVAAELHKAVLWHRANPSRQKTLRGMPRFLFAWLSRDRSGWGGQQAPQAPPTPPAGGGPLITTNGGLSVWDLVGPPPERAELTG